MNKFGIQTERINKIQSLLPILLDKTLLIAFYEKNFVILT